MQAHDRLEHFPVAFFATVMGMEGLAIAWEKWRHVAGVDWPLGQVLTAIVTLQFIVILAIFLLRVLRHPQVVKKDLRHPVKLSFFPAISISLLLLAIGWLPWAREAARWLWLAGAGLHLLMTLYVMNAWIHHTHFEIQHISPAWFIPVVGNAIVPVAGVPLGYVEASWFYFGIAMVFWLVLLAIIFYRVLFHQPLPDRLMPTLFILIAPPAVGFIAYFRLAHGLDNFGRVLYGASLFLTLLLLVQIHRFARLRFFLSWWAYSFPLAAMTIATLVMYEATGITGYRVLGVSLLGLTTAVVLLLLARTAIAIRRRGICVPEG